MKAMRIPLFTKRLPICNYWYFWLNVFGPDLGEMEVEWHIK
jgi:hypothetical protein